MSDLPRRKIGPRSAILLALLALAAVVLSVRRDRVYGPGETIQHGDVFFTLRGVNRSPLPAEGEAGRPAAMVEFVVKLTIENRARKAPFRFNDDSVALVEPESGRRYRVDAGALRAYEAATGQREPIRPVLQAGESQTRACVFRVPAGEADLRLRIAPGGWGGMVLESILFGTKEFRLP